MAENDTPTPDEVKDPSEMSTDDLLRELLAQRAEDRAAIAALREEINRGKQTAPAPSAVALSDEELLAQRMQAISEHDYYCYACGALYDRQRECTGRGEAPHPALEVISTDELRGDDPSKHTAAPGVRP